MSESQEYQPELDENRELVTDKLVQEFAEKEGVNFDDVLSDIITFAPYEGNDSPNPDYIDQVAEMMGISSKELSDYAIKKAKAYLNE